MRWWLAVANFLVREKVDDFFVALAVRTEEVKLRCRRDLQALADAQVAKASVISV